MEFSDSDRGENLLWMKFYCRVRTMKWIFPAAVRLPDVEKLETLIEKLIVVVEYLLLYFVMLMFNMTK